MIYLDYASTTPMSEKAIEAYTKTASLFFGNTNSLHDIGTGANDVLTLCRRQFAHFINGDEKGVYFTSGGSEANYLAIRSLIKGSDASNRHIITTQIEHSSILNLCGQLEEEGYTVTYLPVDKWGMISLSDLQKAVTSKTTLVSIQHANHEIGTIQPIQKIGRFLKEKNILFHCDCVQSFGKLPIDVQLYGVDSLSVSSHKIYGPKGVGAVYIHPSVSWNSVYRNANHQSGFRPGTIDVPGVASFITAAQEAYSRIEEQRELHEQLRTKWMTLMEPFKKFITIEGHPSQRLPSVIGMTIDKIQGQYVMLQCNRHQIAISTGSACHAGLQHPSKTMTAIGKSNDEAKQFIRISFGTNTSYNDLKHLYTVLRKVMEEFHCVTM
ncbi:IscS subfamily cysteine desulfurase [Bacillus songklensis]|uniref:IscS subfamily cysteine desulfurase n=1 Tax=Bacillus songklensis TaxID=1069116 RepID=A0ABV8AYN9_9BACI